MKTLGDDALAVPCTVHAQDFLVVGHGDLLELELHVQHASFKDTLCFIKKGGLFYSGQWTVLLRSGGRIRPLKPPNSSRVAESFHTILLFMLSHILLEGEKQPLLKKVS